MSRLEIHKFGGTSVGTAERIANVAAIIVERAAKARIIVVSSAMSGVTDRLIQAAEFAAGGRRSDAIAIAAQLRADHAATAALLLGSDEITLVALNEIFEELDEILRAVAWLKELTPRTRDLIVPIGEKLAVRLFAAAIRKAGITAEHVDADDFLETDAQFGAANPLWGVVENSIKSDLRPRLARKVIPCVTGFCGRSPKGATTTLGRGGSDFTATLIGGALAADEVFIWTDVAGVYTTDPRIVPEARRIAQLNYREAAELSFYGAKVLHQRTMLPVADQGIPVRIVDSFHPDEPGTTVDGRFTRGSHPVKAISAIPKHALVEIAGNGMAGVPGVSAKLFQALADAAVNVTMISQSSSESSICFAIPEEDANDAELAIKRAFRSDMSHGAVEDIRVQRHICLVAAVGLGMAHSPGVSGQVFKTLGDHGVNVRAIAQGSSELNISFAVDQSQLETAVRALHEAFGLDRIDTGNDSGARNLDILLFGCGNIGQAFVELVLNRQKHVFERFGVRPSIVAISDRSGYLFSPTGLDQTTLTKAIENKANGLPFADQDRGFEAGNADAMVAHATRYRLARPVLVDVSDFDGSSAIFADALQSGCDVVTANKKPLSESFETFERLQRLAAKHGRLFKCEATVGAGLPVLDTLEMLLATGDTLHEAEGSFSGTLAYLMTKLEQGVRFSEAVREAHAMGYTEPDPVADLSGADVARKATILGRFAGLLGPRDTVQLEGLVDPALAGMPLEELFKAIEKYDDPIAKRCADAAERGEVLRFVARVARGTATVGPVTVPSASPIGSLTGTDNMIVFRSARYDERPLVVTGPGAGINVTAMGVLGDVLRVAAERR